MQVAHINRNYDMTEIYNWCDNREFIRMDKIILSDTGFLISDNSKNICAGWLYPVVGSELCWIGFPISNPNTTKEERNKALDLLFHTLIETAREMDYSLVMTTSDTLPVMERLKKHGFIEGDTQVNQYFGRL